MLALALALAAGPEKAIAPRGPNEETLIHFLWYESPITLGALSCDASISREQRAAYDRRFERRIGKLRVAIKT